MSATPMASPSRSGSFAGTAESPPDEPVTIGVKPDSLNGPERRSATSGSKPPRSNGVEIGRSMAPIWEPAAAGMPMTWTSAGRLANGASRLCTAVSTAERPSRVIGSSMRPCASAVRLGTAVASFISAIGVMPAIGSLENAPIEYETAPISLPSM